MCLPFPSSSCFFFLCAVICSFLPLLPSPGALLPLPLFLPFPLSRLSLGLLAAI